LETEEKWRGLRRGWCLGGAKFRERLLNMLDQVSDRLENRRRAATQMRQDHGPAEAERVASRALAALGVSEEELAGTRKNDERKRLVGALVRKTTMASNAWIAERLRMGNPNRVSHYCSRRCWEENLVLGRKLRRLEKAVACDD
jgi:hypothetical protein